ncbi:MAG: Gfo/Idh/MocA family protein [Armatimonadota bacterium]
MEPVRWGVLGTANIGVRAVIPAIRQSRNGRLVAIASRTVAKAEEAATRLGIPRAWGSYDALLDDPEVGAVYIPHPNSMHREWTIRCAEAGKHVLCEKPLGVTAAECREMIAVCRQHGVALMEAFMYRFHPRTMRVAQLAHEGAVGRVRLVRATFTFAVRDTVNNIRMKPELGGGALYDVGCYGISVSRMILGEPDEAFAWGHVGESGVDELVVALLRYGDDRMALVDCSLRLPRQEAYEVVGTDGRLTVPVAFLPGTGDVEIHFTRGTDQTVERITGVNQYQLMVEHFGDVISGGAPLGLPPEDAVANLEVLEALLRSMRSGRPELIARG